MVDDVEGCVTTGELATTGAFAGANDFGSQLVLCSKDLFVQLEFDPQVHFDWHGFDAIIFRDFAVECREVKKDIVTKVFGLNEPEVFFFA
jgi:hypothetical protein